MVKFFHCFLCTSTNIHLNEKKFMTEKKFGKFSSKCRQAESSSLIRLETVIKWKQMVQFIERNKNVISCNWDIDNFTLNLCNFWIFWARICWHHSNDRFFEALWNGHGFFVVLPPTNEPSTSKRSAVFLFGHGYRAPAIKACLPRGHTTCSPVKEFGVIFTI